MDADHSKHELEEDRHHHDVLDGGHGDYHGLDDRLQSLGSLNGSQRSQHSQHSENLEDGDVPRHPSEEDGDEGDPHHQHVQQVGGRPHVSSSLESAIGDDLEGDLQGEDCGEEIIEISQDSVTFGVGIQRVLCSQGGRGYQDTDQKEVS